MFQKIIAIDDVNSVEVSSRLVAGEEKVIVVFRTQKPDNSIISTGAFLDDSEVEILIESLQEALKAKRI